MHHLTYGISFLLRSVNIILFTVLLVHLIFFMHHITAVPILAVTIYHSLRPSAFYSRLKTPSTVFTNPLLHGVSGSVWIALVDLGLD